MHRRLLAALAGGGGGDGAAAGGAPARRGRAPALGAALGATEAAVLGGRRGRAAGPGRRGCAAR